MNVTVNEADMHSIALEGWRRGLKLRFYNYCINDKVELRYSLRNCSKEHFFKGFSGDLNSSLSKDICANKYITYSYLSDANIPTPKFRLFNLDVEYNSFIQYVKNSELPLCLTPVEKEGNIVEIYCRNELKKVIDYDLRLREAKNVIVEHLASGEKISVIVINNKVVGAVKKSDIKIKELNNNNDYHQLYSFTAKNGDLIDITNIIREKHKNIAITAVNAIPGLSHATVDMVINESGEETILAVNEDTELDPYLLSLGDKAGDIPKEMINLYFPETKGVSTENSNVSLNFDGIIHSLRGGVVNQLDIASCTNNVLKARRYVLNGDFDPEIYYQWFRNKVYKQSLNGFMRKLGENYSEIILAGADENQINRFEKNFNHGTVKPYIRELNKEKWEFLNIIGFTLVGKVENLTNKELENRIEELKQKILYINKENDNVKQDIQSIVGSKIWKITLLIRMFLEAIKRFFKS